VPARRKHSCCWSRYSPLLSDPNARIPGRPDQHDGWSPLRCATAGASNEPVIRLLLERGAVPDDHDLYLAGFAEDAHQCQGLLLGHGINMAGSTALAAPVSVGDIEGCGCCWRPALTRVGRLLQDPAARPDIEALRPLAAAAVSLLRILDVALWVSHSETAAARRMRQGVGLLKDKDARDVPPSLDDALITELP